MNFYKHHIGDYAAATAHLTWDEDCAYRRLMTVYYQHEKPIPLDLDAAARLIRARGPAQKRALLRVLEEFFSKSTDGWHQKRCDEDIARCNHQAQQNSLIAQQRERTKRERLGADPTARVVPGSFTSQTPDSRLQTEDKDKSLSIPGPAFEHPMPPEDWQPHPTISARLHMAGAKPYEPIDVSGFIAHYRANNPPPGFRGNWDNLFLSWCQRKKAYGDKPKTAGNQPQQPHQKSASRMWAESIEKDQS